MTSNKCEHVLAGGDSAWEHYETHHERHLCGQRFIPSDVLEEARDALWWAKSVLPHVLARIASGSELGPASWEKCETAQTKAEAALARIDAVLGRTR